MSDDRWCLEDDLAMQRPQDSDDEEFAAVMDIVDQAWQAPPELIESVKQKFLALLPPDHPWRNRLTPPENNMR